MDDAGTFDGVASIDDASIAFDDDRRLGATDATTRTTDATTRTVEGTTAVGTTTTNATMVESRGDARTDDEDDANVTLEMYLSGDVVLARGGGKNRCGRGWWWTRETRRRARGARVDRRACA